MFGLNKAWFYLTLWRGTPPDFTTEFDAEITEADKRTALIHTTDTANANIQTLASAIANVVRQELIGTDIITTTEVVWYVN